MPSGKAWPVEHSQYSSATAWSREAQETEEEDPLSPQTSVGEFLCIMDGLESNLPLSTLPHSQTQPSS